MCELLWYTGCTIYNSTQQQSCITVRKWNVMQVHLCIIDTNSLPRNTRVEIILVFWPIFEPGISKPQNDRHPKWLWDLGTLEYKAGPNDPAMTSDRDRMSHLWVATLEYSRITKPSQFKPFLQVSCASQVGKRHTHPHRECWCLVHLMRCSSTVNYLPPVKKKEWCNFCYLHWIIVTWY
jgi:hypothetical protein